MKNSKKKFHKVWKEKKIPKIPGKETQCICFPIVLRLQKIYKASKQLLNNFFYTQLTSFLFLRKIFIMITMILKLFFLFLLQLNFDIFLGPFFVFFFLLQKNFGIFHVVLFGAFLCVFDNSYLSLLYIEKNIMKNVLSFFLYALTINFIVWVM